MDRKTERKVTQWKEAKERSDYATADRIREELREVGVDPDPRRGGNRGSGAERKIQQWQTAKQNKDYATADAIREELRAQGVDPDPRGRDADPMPMPPQMAFMAQQMSFMQQPMKATVSSRARQYNAEEEAEMDRWEEAKADKDYATADAIRAELRKRGRSPDKERLKATVHDMVNQWQAAKRAKDFDRSDRIRETLRAQGIEPEHMGDMMMAMPFMQPAAIVKGDSSKYGVRAKSSKDHPNLSNMDGDDLDQVEQWYAAKDEKNFEESDRIRAVLRQKGIEPDNCQRPGAAAAAGMDEETEEELRQWFEAKESKNWGIADSIREGLRAKGVEPSQFPRPETSSGYGKVSSQKISSRSKPYQAAADTSFDYETEAKMDKWWQYKQDKKYAMADKIRAELRAQGVEPDKHRPVR